MKTAVEQVFTDHDAGLFVELERVIERGLKTFIEVGQALTRIRDGRLYRLGDYTSFDTYCVERWNFDRSRADQLIKAAEVTTTVVNRGLPAPANERQARELARVPADERADVWAVARDRSAGRPTAETIRDIVKERKAPPVPPEPARVPDPATSCEACGTEMLEDQVAAGYMRCDDCDSEGEHYAVNFPYGRGGGCIGCHPELEQGYVPIGTPGEPAAPVDAKARQKAEIAQSYRNLSDTLNAIPPERIAEINESVKPAVEFGQLVSACRQFAEMLARIDLDYAARGIDTDQLPTIRKTLDLARRVEQILGVPT